MITDRFQIKKTALIIALLSLFSVNSLFANNGSIIMEPVVIHLELVNQALPTVSDVKQLTFFGVEYRNTTDTDGSVGLSAGDTARIDGVFAVTSFVSSNGTIIPLPGFLSVWEMTGTYVALKDILLPIDVSTPNTIPYVTQPDDVGILTLYVDMSKDASAGTGFGYDDGTKVAEFVVSSGGGVYTIIAPFDGSRDMYMLKEYVFPGFFDPEITGMVFDCNLDADPDDNGVGGDDLCLLVDDPLPAPTDWQYPTTEVNYPWSYYVLTDGSMRFGYLYQIAGECRMTGGNATVSPAIGIDNIETWTYDFNSLDEDFWITTGGQIGAPSGGEPRGHWTHVQHGGAEGNFVFHSGTSSAPDGTEISTIECADPGWCVQARCAPFKQIFWTGVGNFAKQGFDGVFSGCNVVADIPRKDGTLHFYRAMVGDFGENNRPTREVPGNCNWLLPNGPPGPFDASSAVFLDSVIDPQFGDKGGQICDTCPDYYQIEIYCNGNNPDDDPTNEVIYTFSGFLESGNYQIHPETGTHCPVIIELVPELFESTKNVPPGLNK
ncbi:MAG: hypothetical protein JRD93_07860 [Deltaproteobacteria bacterium]|nr:hypothetical protein [Deltaproteobacteria bacterium]